MSIMKADRKLKYVEINYGENILGTWIELRDFLLKDKDARVKGGSKMDIDIFRPDNGGIPNMIYSVRYCETLEELDLEEDTEAMYDKVNGKNSHFKAWGNYLSKLKSLRSELRVLRTDMSQL